MGTSKILLKGNLPALDKYFPSRCSWPLGKKIRVTHFFNTHYEFCLLSLGVLFSCETSTYLHLHNWTSICTLTYLSPKINLLETRTCQSLLKQIWQCRAIQQLSLLIGLCITAATGTGIVVLATPSPWIFLIASGKYLTLFSPYRAR